MLWYDMPHRTTRDADLLGFGSNDLESIAQTFRDIASELFVSESVLRECGAGNPDAAQKRLAVLNDVPLLLITEQALYIAESLVRQGIVPPRAAEDALHIAVATVNGVDYLLTWNCRHIANPEIQRGIAAYLEQIGLFLPFICTPEELLGEENVE